VLTPTLTGSGVLFSPVIEAEKEANGKKTNKINAKYFSLFLKFFKF